MKAKQLLFFLGILITPLFLHAQVSVVYEYCSVDNEALTSFASAEDGGYYVSLTTPDNSGVATIVRFNADNQQMWDFELPETVMPRDLLEIDADLYIIADKDLDPGSAENDDICIMKLQDGSLVWENCLGGSATERPYRAFFAGGQIFVMGAGYSQDGVFAESNGGAEGILFATDTSGAQSFSFTIGGAGSDVVLSAGPKNEEQIVLGRTTSTDGALAGLGSTGAPNFFLLKLDALGNTIGGYVMDPMTEEVVVSAEWSSDENLGYITGFRGSNTFVACIDQNGLVWESLHGAAPDQFESVMVTSDGGCIAVGKITDPGMYYHPYVVRYDRWGNMLWSHEFSSETAGYSWSSSVRELSDGTFLIGGSNEISPLFGCETIGRKAWFVRLEENILLTHVVEHEEEPLLVKPNPSYGPFALSGSDGLVVAYDLLGREVYSFFLRGRAEQISLSAGMYSLVHENGEVVRVIVR